MEAQLRMETEVELATFYVGEALCGINIMQIQEINKVMERTPVPQAPDYVLGVLNLRGRIVTIIDLAKKLGLGETPESAEARNLIVNSSDGTAGLLVSKIGDVVMVDLNQREPTPANMGGIQSDYFSGVCKQEGLLIGILDIDRILQLHD